MRLAFLVFSCIFETAFGSSFTLPLIAVRLMVSMEPSS